MVNEPREHRFDWWFPSNDLGEPPPVRDFGVGETVFHDVARPEVRHLNLDDVSVARLREGGGRRRGERHDQQHPKDGSLIREKHVCFYSGEFFSDETLWKTLFFFPLFRASTTAPVFELSSRFFCFENEQPGDIASLNRWEALCEVQMRMWFLAHHAS